MNRNITFRKSIAHHLLKMVFGFYFIVTLSLTMFQMGLEYYRTKNNILGELKNLRKIFEPALSSALWSIDTNQVTVTLEGMLNTQVLVGVQVISSENEVIEKWNQNFLQQKKEEWRNQIPLNQQESLFSGLFSFESDLNYVEEDDTFQVGQLIMYSTNTLVWEKARPGIIIILVNAMIKTIVLWFLFLIVFRKVLGRPLSMLTSTIEKMDWDHLDDVKFYVHSKHENELKILEESFNNMVHKLRQAHQNLKNYVENLKQMNIELTKMDQLKDEFIANVSHELRTPLNGIVGFAKLLKMNVVENEEQKVEYYENIYTSGQRLLRILNNVINLSMFESGSKSVVYAPVNISALMKKIKYKWQSVLKERFTLEVSEDIRWESDSKILEIVLNEIIHNSVVFNEHQPEVRICLQNMNNNITIKISDNGVGISEEHIPKIFEKFYRVESDIQYKITGGIGLGLALVKEAVQALHGHVSVENRRGDGLTITLCFPSKPAQVVELSPTLVT